MSAFLEYLEGFDPHLEIYNTYDVYLYCALFLFLFVKTRNIFALVIIFESVLTHFSTVFFSGIHIADITGQFVIYGFLLYLTRKNPRILLAYLLIMGHFLIQYITNFIHLAHNTWNTYNIAVLVYYSYFALLPLVLYLMIKGLFSGWGKGRESDRYNIGNDGFNGINYFMPDNYHSRFKRLFKKRNQRV